MPDVIRLVEEVLSHEAAGRTIAAPKFNSDVEGGAMCIVFAADYEAGYGATKAYHRVKGAAAPMTKRATLAQLVSGRVKVPRQGLVAYKAVGNALQDLALAGRFYDLLGKRSGVPAAADLASVRRPIRELRDAKPVSRRRDPAS